MSDYKSNSKSKRDTLYKTSDLHLVRSIKQEIFSRALGSYPKEKKVEEEESRNFLKLFEDTEYNVVIAHPYMNLKIRSHQLLAPRMAYLFSIGDYEQTDLDLLNQYLKPGMAVLELGAGIGVTAALSAVKSEREVIVVDADKRIRDMVVGNIQLNGGQAHFVEGCVFSGIPEGELVDFYLHPEIWFSSRHSANSDSFKVSVPTVGLNGLLMKYKPDFMVVDIEGAEEGLFNRSLAHKPDYIMIEIHTPIFREKKSAEIIQSIIDLGYDLTDFSGWTFLFRRKRR